MSKTKTAVSGMPLFMAALIVSLSFFIKPYHIHASEGKTDAPASRIITISSFSTDDEDLSFDIPGDREPKAR